MVSVHQLVYTRVSAQDSPHGREGFQTLFFPRDLLGPGELGEIERRIYLPEGVTQKEVVFFLNLGGEDYLILIHLRDLPEARDRSGRRGIFLGHGFLFPPALWRRAPNPRSLLFLVQDHLCENLEEVFASPLVDRDTGNFRPLELTEEALGDLPKALPRLTEAEWRLVAFLSRFARMEPSAPLEVAGAPEEVSRLLNRLVSYLPAALWLRLSWDTAFDGGALHHHPVRIVGFSRLRPMGGEPLELDARTLDLPGGAGRTSRAKPNDRDDRFHHEATVGDRLPPELPFDRWLERCREEIDERRSLEAGWRLSEMARGAAPWEELAGAWGGFAAANASLIEARFLERCSERIGPDLAQAVSARLDPESKLKLLMKDLPADLLAELVERAVLEERLFPVSFRNWRPLAGGLARLRQVLPKVRRARLPAELVQCRPALALLERIWRGEAPPPEEIADLPAGLRRDLLRYLLAGPWRHLDGLFQLLRDDPELFRACAATPEDRRALGALLWRRLKTHCPWRLRWRLRSEIDRALARGEGYRLLQLDADQLHRLLEEDTASGSPPAPRR